MKKKFVIVAPHADDEIIGCWELIRDKLVHSVLFSNQVTKVEIQRARTWLSEHDCIAAYYSSLPAFSVDKIYLFPDPMYETHPMHRKFGAIGERLLREKNADVWFYSINMNAPYIREVVGPAFKLKALNLVYPHKSSLWKYDHKYFLFEGYTKWIMRWND